MRILHAIQELRTGGAERLVVALAEGSSRAGHEVATASTPGPLAQEAGGEHFPLPLVERRPWRIAAAARALRAAVGAWRPDLVHAHNPGMAVTAAVANRRVPALVSVHGVPDEDYRSAAWILRMARLPVIACGPGVASGLAEHGLDPEETIVNGISPAPPPADRKALEREWGLRPDMPLVVSAGRLAPVKNHLAALSAIARLPDVNYALLGEGQLASDLERARRDLALVDRVALPGLRRDARAIIGAADAVLISSRSEGLPLVALEALAAGTPIVATAVRGVRELVEHERTALLAPPGDAQALADALRRLLGDAELRQRLSSAGRALAADYTEDAMLERYFAVYRRFARDAQ